MAERDGGAGAAVEEEAAVEHLASVLDWQETRRAQKKNTWVDLAQQGGRHRPWQEEGYHRCGAPRQRA